MKFKGGRVPYGFFNADGELKFDTNRPGHVLVTLMRLREEGISYRQLAENLNRNECPGPSAPTWNHASVARVIANGKRYSALIPLKYILNN